VIRSRLAALLVTAAVSLAPPPAASQASPAATDPARTGHPRIVCLGDSLTEGFGLATEQAWPALLEAMLRSEKWPRAEVVNVGVSGSTSASAVSRLQWQLRSPPDVLVLALGANDGLRGVAPAETKKNLAAVIDIAQSKGIAVLLAGMKMPPNYGAEYTREFEAIFTSLAAEKKVPLIPFLLEGVAADPALNLPDGIHPNAEGYAIIARVVATHLRPMLAKYAGVKTDRGGAVASVRDATRIANAAADSTSTVAAAAAPVHDAR
jgi:acyl-CoA thioesterase I